MTGNRYPLVSQRVRTQGQKPVAIDSPAIVAEILALASTGMSRRGIARSIGVAEATFREWLDRGEAEPDREPYGPFARAYGIASRRLERGISSVEALRVQQLAEQMQACHDWDKLKVKPVDEVVDPATGEVRLVERRAPKPPAPADFEWMLRLKQSRWPDDHGTSAHHRVPEPEPSGEAWLERTGMNHAQLVHMLKDPPEPIAKALGEAADQVYELLLSTGWQPKGSDV